MIVGTAGRDNKTWRLEPTFVHSDARPSVANVKSVIIEVRDRPAVFAERIRAYIKYAPTHDINTYLPRDHNVASAWVFLVQCEAH